MRDWLKALPILLAASALLIAATAEKEGQRSAQMLAAGFVILGAWVATVIWEGVSEQQRRKERDQDDEKRP